MNKLYVRMKLLTWAFKKSCSQKGLQSSEIAEKGPKEAISQNETSHVIFFRPKWSDFQLFLKYTYSTAKEILVNLPSGAKRKTQGKLVNQSLRAKWEAHEILVNQSARAKREV